MKIVITGANSFIGKNLISHFENRKILADHEIVLVSRTPMRRSSNSITNICCDLENYDKLGSKVGSCDCLFHLAWTGTRGNSRNNHDEQKYAKDCSLKGIRSILERGCGKILTAGSQAEYGIISGKVSEKNICRPNTEYGIQKLDLYKETLALCVEYETVCVEPRFFSLYGPGDYSGTMIISMLRRMLKHEACDLTECKQKWNFLHIDDACSALERLCLNDSIKSGVYNFGSNETQALYEFVYRMKEIAQSKSTLNFGTVPYPKTGMVSIWPDNTKLKEAIDWNPLISFDDGIKDILKTLM